MVRQNYIIDKKLRKINSEIINFNFPVFFGVRNAIANYWFLKGKSWALAWALNKVEHDKRGDRFNDKRKKAQ